MPLAWAGIAVGVIVIGAIAAGASAFTRGVADEVTMGGPRVRDCNFTFYILH